LLKDVSLAEYSTTMETSLWVISESVMAVIKPT
jgi:hypothetical protein